MSMHKTHAPMADLNAALIAHHLPHDKPSQLADGFRSGWIAATAAQAEALAAVTRERDALRKAVAPMLQQIVDVCRANCYRVVVATVQRRLAISWDSAQALCIEADRQGMFAGFDTSALFPLRTLTTAQAKEQA